MDRRVALWAAAGLALLVLLGVGVWRYAGSVEQRPRAEIGGPFQMVDQNGHTIDQNLLEGKWTAMFFGYTYCPDVCPTTLQTLGTTLQQMGDRAKQLRVVFVSVDPARDTPAQLRDFLANPAFPPGAVGLTGTDAQVAAIAKAYRVYYQRQGTGTNYTVDHSAVIYLIRPDGSYDTGLPFDLPPDQMKTQILKAMDAG